LIDHFAVCLDHIAIDLHMPVQGLGSHLWRSRVTELDYEELLLLLTLTLLEFKGALCGAENRGSGPVKSVHQACAPTWSFPPPPLTALIEGGETSSNDSDRSD